MSKDQNLDNTKNASLIIRLLAILYDAFLVAAILMIATLPYILLIGGPPQTFQARLILQIYLLLIVFIFFSWFWTHGGQTLGMRSWRLKLVTESGQTLNWQQAALRWLTALLNMLFLGLGYLWILFDPEKRALHDILSHTRVVRLPKENQMSGNPAKQPVNKNKE